MSVLSDLTQSQIPASAASGVRSRDVSSSVASPALIFQALQVVLPVLFRDPRVVLLVLFRDLRVDFLQVFFRALRVGFLLVLSVPLVPSVPLP